MAEKGKMNSSNIGRGIVIIFLIVLYGCIPNHNGSIISSSKIRAADKETVTEEMHTVADVLSKLGQPRTAFRTADGECYIYNKQATIISVKFSSGKVDSIGTIPVHFRIQNIDRKKCQLIEDDIIESYRQYMKSNLRTDVYSFHFSKATDLPMPIGISEKVLKEIQQLLTLNPVKVVVAVEGIRSLINQNSMSKDEYHAVVPYLLRAMVKCRIPDGKELVITGPGLPFGRQGISLSGRITSTLKAIADKDISAISNALINPHLDALEKLEAIYFLKESNNLAYVKGIDDSILFHSLSYLARNESLWDGYIGLDIVTNAVSALGYFDSPAAEEVIVSLILSPDWRIRHWAREAAKNRMNNANASSNKRQNTVFALGVLKKIENYAEYRVPGGDFLNLERNDFIEYFIRNLKAEDVVLTRNARNKKYVLNKERDNGKHYADFARK